MLQSKKSLPNRRPLESVALILVMEVMGVMGIAAPQMQQALAAPAWYSGILGDPRSVGRGGIGVALADDFWSVIDNPAGSALTTADTALQFSTNTITDTLSDTQPLRVYSGGMVVPVTPWGFATGYESSNLTGNVREYTLSASRLLLRDHLSVGLSFNYGFSSSGPSSNSLNSLNSFVSDTQAWGLTSGVLYRLEHRVMIGAKFRSQMNYPAGDGTPFYHPWELNFGVGQIRNRFFRYGLELRTQGPSSPNSSSWSLQPHLGVEYQVVNLRQIQIRLYSGSYLEGSRLHGTGGGGVNFWIFSLSAGADLGPSYQNILFALGVDLGKTAKKLKILPSSVQAPIQGPFPDPLEVSDDWLPRRLQDDPENSFQEIGPSAERLKNRIIQIKKIGQDQPDSLREEKDSFSKDWNELREGLNESAP